MRPLCKLWDASNLVSPIPPTLVQALPLRCARSLVALAALLCLKALLACLGGRPVAPCWLTYSSVFGVGMSAGEASRACTAPYRLAAGSFRRRRYFPRKRSRLPWASSGAESSEGAECARACVRASPGQPGPVPAGRLELRNVSAARLDSPYAPLCLPCCRRGCVVGGAFKGRA